MIESHLLGGRLGEHIAPFCAFGSALLDLAAAGSRQAAARRRLKLEIKACRSRPSAERYPQFLPPFFRAPRPPVPCSALCAPPPPPFFFVDPDSKFTSFQRQLNLYQFKRRKGAHAGAFHHPSFRRGQRHLLSKVRRQKVKRDLAVEARAAQRLARSKGSGGGGGVDGSGLSGRGRTRGAAQADLRPIRRRRQIEDSGDDTYVSDEDEEFALSPGSRRSALRRRVDAGPATRGGGGIGARYTQDNNDDESSTDDAWHSENNSSGLDQFSSGDDEERLDWGRAGYSNGSSWRQQVPGSPERSSRELHHVSTPMTMTPKSEYGQSPSSSSIGLDRSSSISSSMASSLSFTSSPSHSEMMFEQHSGSSPYQFTDCDESGRSDSANEHSPMSIHSPDGHGRGGATTVHDAAAAAGAQVSPAQQRQRDNDLSLAAVVDATISGWSSPHPSSSLPHLEQFGWGAANVSSAEAGMPWSDPSASAAPPAHHNQAAAVAAAAAAAQGSPTQEDFGFIDLFATNWDSVTSGSSPASPPADSAGMISSSSGGNDGGGGGGGGGRDTSANDTFLKEAQAAGVFGVEDFLAPASRSSGGAAGGYVGTVDYA